MTPLREMVYLSPPLETPLSTTSPRTRLAPPFFAPQLENGVPIEPHSHSRSVVRRRDVPVHLRISFGVREDVESELVSDVPAPDDCHHYAAPG